jgi:type II secretory pathway pseudopilin PulG
MYFAKYALFVFFEKSKKKSYKLLFQNNKNDVGYSILEVMIFLAITGALFASAAVGIGGSQRQAQYSQSVRDLEMQIKDVANDVQNGFYPVFTNGRCTKTVGANPTINFIDLNEPASPGTNQGCIYVGKIMMFDIDTNSNRFGVGTIVGANSAIGQNTDLSLDSLNPKLAYTDGLGSQINLTTYKPIQFGSRITKIASDTPAQTYKSLFFMSNFGNSNFLNPTLSGLLATDVYGVLGSVDTSGSATLNNYSTIVSGLGDGSTAVVKNANSGYYVCLLTTDNRRARIILGVDGVNTATSTEFDIDDRSVCP